MADVKRMTSVRFSKRAQSIIELAVFGAIFIFVLGTIIQQGFAAANSQQAKLQALRHALLLSYTTGMASSSKRNMASYMIFEDRLTPGLFKYGTLDRIPSVSFGAGSMSQNLYMTVDWVDAQQNISIMDLQVNGQSFELTQGATYYLRLSRDVTTLEVTALASQNPFPEPADGATPEEAAAAACSVSDGRSLQPDNITRLKREWPNAYTVAALGNTTFPTDNADWEFDYNRNGDYTDDVWNLPTMRGLRLDTSAAMQGAVWAWTSMSFGAIVINEDQGDYPSLDVTGDLSEDVVFWKGKVYGGVYNCSAGVTKQVYDMGILDPSAGDASYEDPARHPDKDERQGMRLDASIYTEVDGAVLELRNGAGFIAGTNDLANSATKKNQYDIISRAYQLNRSMLFPETFSARNPAVEVVCGNVSSIPDPAPANSTVGCCMSPGNVLQTCFDRGSRVLYIRSRIRDLRGRMWINKVNTRQK